jgi:demethylmenaquinone methyltransferase/2-methoxy-6-polyprenyl-1,4-benzoquinol methylase
MIDKRSSPALFDQIASTYDKVNRLLSLGLDKRWRRRLASSLPFNARSVLDLATGTGDQLIANQKIACQASHLGIDLSSEMIALAKKKAPHASFQIGDIQKLPLRSSFFDAATLSFGIRNVPSVALALSEIHRVLSSKGKLLILEFSLPPFPLKKPYLFFLRHLLPRVGSLFSSHPTAYRYLNQTIETFPYGDAFAKHLKEAGFSSIRYDYLALGAVCLYSAIKK